MDERESEGLLYVQGNRDLREKRQEGTQEGNTTFSLKLSQRGEGLVYKKTKLNVFRMRFQQTALVQRSYRTSGKQRRQPLELRLITAEAQGTDYGPGETAVHCSPRGWLATWARGPPPRARGLHICFPESTKSHKVM